MCGAEKQTSYRDRYSTWAWFRAVSHFTDIPLGTGILLNGTERAL